MTDVITTDFSALYKQFTDDSLIDETQRRATVPSGWYIGIPDQVKVCLEGGTDERFPKRFKRQYATFSMPVKNKEGRKIGRFDFDVSWEVRRVAKSGGLDSLSIAFNALKNALGLRGKSDGDVVEAIGKKPLEYNIREIYQDDKGNWLDVSDATRAELKANGTKMINTFNGVRTVKTQAPSV